MCACIVLLIKVGEGKQDAVQQTYLTDRVLNGRKQHACIEIRQPRYKESDKLNV